MVSKGSEEITHRTYRAPMNMPTDWAAVWTAVAMHIIAAPMRMVFRRPRPSDKYGANGYPAREPMFCGQISISIIRRSHEAYHLNSIQKTQFPACGESEGRFPLWQRLQTVHHTSIVSVGRRGDETRREHYY